jgi:hypothetical protein
MKILKKSDWGDVWVTSADLNEGRLKKLSLDLIHKLGLRVCLISDDAKSGVDSKEIWDLNRRS